MAEVKVIETSSKNEYEIRINSYLKEGYTLHTASHTVKKERGVVFFAVMLKLDTYSVGGVERVAYTGELGV